MTASSFSSTAVIRASSSSADATPLPTILSPLLDEQMYAEGMTVSPATGVEPAPSHPPKPTTVRATAGPEQGRDRRGADTDRHRSAVIAPPARRRVYLMALAFLLVGCSTGAATKAVRTTADLTPAPTVSTTSEPVTTAVPPAPPGPPQTDMADAQFWSTAANACEDIGLARSIYDSGSSRDQVVRELNNKEPVALAESRVYGWILQAERKARDAIAAGADIDTTIGSVVDRCYRDVPDFHPDLGSGTAR